MTPLLGVTLTYAAGLLIGLRAAPPTFALLCSAVIATALIAIVRVRMHAVLLVFCVAGVALGALRARATTDDCRARTADGAAVTLIGVPLAQPTAGTTTRIHARVFATDERACRDVVVRVHMQPPHLPLLDSAAHGRAGAVRIGGRWLAYEARNGWPRAPELSGSVLIDDVSEAAGAPSRRAGPLVRFRTAQQARLRALLPERWGVAEALLLAQKSGLTPETRARWVAAGLVHLLAISGMHVGLIAGGVLLLCSQAGLPRRTARRTALLLTAAYVLFLGAPTAALRALLQATLLLGSLELQRPAEPFTALAAAALVIILLEPLALLDPGFQLSFAGMIGLIGWSRPAAALLPRRWPAYVRDGIAAGIAASALTTPIAALHFGTASWIGVPASLLAVPVMAAAVALLVSALLIAALTGAVTGPHALLADAALRVLDMIAAAAARVPGGHGYLSATAVFALLAAAAVFVLVRRVLHARQDELPPPIHADDAAHAAHARRGQRRRLRFALAVGAGAVIVAWSPLLLRPHHGQLEIHAIDVGQGDAYAIRTPRSRWILVDTGPRTARRDAGRDAVIPYLLRHGVQRIDALILTHPDADHIGGAEAVLDAFDIALVIDPGLAAGKDIFLDLLHAARRSGTRWIAGRDGIRFQLDGVEITVLYPIGVLDDAASANDNSVVFRLAYGAFAALFLGDAPTAVEDELIARHGSGLRVDVLKVGHHGSRTSTGEALLRTTRPTVALVSAGRNNRYGHPAPAVVQRLLRHEVRVLRTDEHGDITVRADRTGRLEVFTR